MDTEKLLVGVYAKNRVINILSSAYTPEYDVDKLASDISTSLLNIEAKDFSKRLKEIIKLIENNKDDINQHCLDNEHIEGDGYTFLFILITVSEIMNRELSYLDVEWDELLTLLSGFRNKRALELIKLYLQMHFLN